MCNKIPNQKLNYDEPLYIKQQITHCPHYKIYIKPQSTFSIDSAYVKYVKKSCLFLKKGQPFTTKCIHIRHVDWRNVTQFGKEVDICNFTYYLF
uniref:Uncharacterized protein n=1 Tax=Strongyloides papillosus TaxID=174720 RepID=A0A0N5C3T6_STREA